MRDRQFPGHPGALIAQNFRRALAEFRRCLPLAQQIGTQSAGPDSQTNRVRIRGALRQTFSSCGEFLSPFLFGSPLRGSLGYFESHGPRYTIDLTSAQRQKQMAALKVSALDQIDYAQAG